MSISTPKVKPVPGGPRMTRYIALLSLTVVIGIAVLSSSAITEPQAATAADRCRSTNGGASNIVARNMGCSFARDVAQNFMSKIKAGGAPPRRAGVRNHSFKCTTKHFQPDPTSYSACSAQIGSKRAKVTFQWEAPSKPPELRK